MTVEAHPMTNRAGSSKPSMASMASTPNAGPSAKPSMASMGSTRNDAYGNEKNADKEANDKEANGRRPLMVDMSTIELKAEDLYDKEKVDLEALDLADVYRLLEADESGLSAAEVQRRIELFGPNKIESKEQNPILQFLSFMWNPLSWVMEGAAIVAIALSNGGGRPPDWQDFLGIVLLLLINSTIGFLEERSAGNAVKALMDSLAPKAKAKRDGEWKEIESSELVPGDIIAFKHGDIVPADCRLFDAINVSIDQAALTGESLPVNKKPGDQCFSGSTCKQGEAEGMVISTGCNTFFGRAAALVGEDDDSTGHLQKVLARIGLFCIATIGLFIVLEILILYAGFRYDYRRGLDDILVLLIGGIPIAMPTVLSVTLAVGASQLAKHKAIVTRITAIEELAGVTILCSDKTGTLTTNKLTIDKELIKTYGDYSAKDTILFAAQASRTENQDAIDGCVVGTLDDPADARRGIEVVDFKPFDPVAKRTEATYVFTDSKQMRRVTKGMSPVILDLCSRNKTQEQIDRLEADVEDFANRGLRALAVAVEDVPSNNQEEPGNGFELVGLLAIFDPPRDDTKKTLEDAQALGVQVKMATGDALAIAKETGRRLGLGDNMYNAQALQTGAPPAGCPYATLDEMILHADGFAGVFPEHKFDIVKRLQALGHLTAMTGDGANDAPALSRANVGVAVEGATDAARGAADIVLTEPGLSTIVDAIRGSRIIFQRMRNYSIYACAVTIRVVVGFALMAFIWKFDFPPFMILIVAILNDGTIMTLSLDRVLPSDEPDHWDLFEIFSFAIGYGLYLTASQLVFFAVVFHTSFFEDKFGVPGYKDEPNSGELHMIIYLYVSITSQALIFVTRSKSWFFLERPSYALMGAFLLAQFISSIISAFGDWGFAFVDPIHANWIGIVWIWSIIWMIPLDLMKFTVRRIVRGIRAHQSNRRNRYVEHEKELRRRSTYHESLYGNRVSFLSRAQRKIGFSRLRGGGKKIHMSDNEVQRMTSIQASSAHRRLSTVQSRHGGTVDV